MQTSHNARSPTHASYSTGSPKQTPCRAHTAPRDFQVSKHEGWVISCCLQATALHLVGSAGDNPEIAKTLLNAGVCSLCCCLLCALCFIPFLLCSETGTAASHCAVSHCVVSLNVLCPNVLCLNALCPTVLCLNVLCLNVLSLVVLCPTALALSVLCLNVPSIAVSHSMWSIFHQS